MSRRFFVSLLCAVATLGVLAGQAVASPGAYKILLAEAFPEGAKKLAAQLATFPEVTTVDFANTELESPSAAQLAPYDAVVSIGDNSYFNEATWGNALADYIDGGGVVVQAAYDTWENAFPKGRFETGGYAPLIPGDNVNDNRTLGAFDAANPLMQGVAPLTSEDNTTNALAPGASLVASWTDGAPAIAQKGRVVAVTANIGDHYPEVWTGNYGRLVLNAVRTLGRQLLTVAVSNSAGGTITSSTGGLACGAVCSALFPGPTAVTLTAKPKKGFAFAGYAGACAGKTCDLKLASGAISVSANFVGFKLGKKVKLDKARGNGTLTVTLGASGELVLNGKKVKKQTRSPKRAGKVKLPVVAKGKALAQLRETGKARVKLKLAYTPTGGAKSTLTKSVLLKLAE